MSAQHFLEPLLQAGAPKYRLIHEPTGQPIATELELAAESRTRNRGLLGRAGLSAGSALILAPCNAVHTFFMRFSIDLVFVNRAGVVLKTRRGVKPWRISLCLGAFATVEMAAGALDVVEIEQGDRLTLSDLHRG